MKPHVVLIADAGGEIGWGHAVRQLALAEALVAQKVRTLFVTRTKEALALDWPCPVRVVESRVYAGFGGRAVVDADVEMDALCDLTFDDYAAADPRGELVNPHFGAADRYGKPHGTYFLGPRWAPLRPEFRWGAQGPRWTVSGKHSDEPLEYAGAKWLGYSARQVIEAMAFAPFAIVPPSMIALECLAVGVPVVLRVPGPKWQPIADAMVAAGVAVMEGDEGIQTATNPTTAKAMSEAGREAVDGRGAARLAEWLADA